MKYAQKWEDRISGELIRKCTAFPNQGGVRTLVVNPKDLNKDRGLTKWVLYFYLPYWFPKSSYMMFLLLSFECSRSSIVFFMGDEPQRYPKQKRGYCVKLNQTSWVWFKRKNAGNPNEPSEFFVARPFWRVKDCAWPLALIGRWGRYDHVWQFRRIRTHTKCRLPILAIGGL